MSIFEGLKAYGMYGWDRVHHPRSRAEELLALRQELCQEAPAYQLSPAEESQVEKIKELRDTLLSLSGPVTSCSTCATGCPLPHGQWDGGFCCSGNTEEIFSTVELAFLRAIGVQFSDLTPPSAEHAGCVFRGPKGCSLQPHHRPNLCLCYICKDLTHELAQKGRLDNVEEVAQQLRDATYQFAKARSERLNAEEVARWEKEVK